MVTVPDVIRIYFIVAFFPLLLDSDGRLDAHLEVLRPKVVIPLPNRLTLILKIKLQ